MSYKIATIRVSGVEARVIDKRPIPAGIVGAVVEIIYDDPLWDGLTKNVTFRGAEERTILDTGNAVGMPSAVVNAPNCLLQVGIVGVAADDEVVIPTLWAELGVIRTGAPVDPEHKGDEEPSVIPIWKRLEEAMQTLEREVEDLKKNPPGGGLSITDDGEGNVTITASGNTQITDDGSGNVVIS